MAYCNKCGNAISDGERYCSACGAPVGDENSQQHNDNQQPQPQYDNQSPQQQYDNQPPQQQSSDNQPQQQFSNQPPQQQFSNQQPQQQFNNQQPQQQYSSQPPQQQFGAQQPLQPYSSGNYAAPMPAPGINSGPGSFAELMHKYGGSGLFLLGIVLFTLGSLAPHFISFNIYGILTLILQALPIIGFWLVFAASRSPKLPEKTLPALTLFKISVIITFVAFCLVALLLLILSIVAMATGSALGFSIATILGIVLLIITAIVLLFVIIYYSSVLRVINGIRRHIIGNIMEPLRGANTFSILTFIFIGISILSVILSLFSFSAIDSYISGLLTDIPHEASDVIAQFMPSSSDITLSSLLSLASGLGTLFCVATLSKFNSSIKRNTKPQYDSFR